MTLAKLTRPRLGRLLARPRLFRLLDARRPLAWVWGPPGAGKTALVASWTEARRVRTLWYHCDAGDTSVETFVDYLTRAAGGARGRAMMATGGSVRDLVRALFERLAVPFVVVLDGYQEIPADSPVHDAMRVVVDELPDGARIVIASRAEPPPAFVRLRASRAITDVGWTDLRLTAAESRALVRRLAPALPARQLGTLHERAAGWAAGLVLMLQDRRALADERRRAPDRIVDYFATELLAKETADTQEILLQTAFLPHLTSAMAAALTGRPHAGRVLARLHRQNCFTVGHAAASAVYEYHPLFRAFLLRRAYAVLTVEQRADIQRRAAGLLERDGQLDAAAGLLRDAGDWSTLALLVQSHSPALLHDARAQRLADWIAVIPPEVTQQHPGLLLRRAAGQLVTEPSAARGDLETALTLFRRGGDTVGALLSWALIIETFAMEHDDIRALDTWIATGEKLLLEIPTYPSIDVETRVASSMLLALMYRQPHHRDVNRWLARTIELADKASDVDVRVSATVAVLRYQLWLGDLDNALVRAEDVRTLLRSPAVRLSGRIAGYLALVRLAWLTGDFEAARDTAEAAMTLDRDSGGAFRHRLAVEAAMAAVSSGDAMQARRWLADLGRDLPHLTRQVRGYYHLAVGWDALQRGDFSAALAEQEKVLTATWQCGMPWLECLARMFAGQVALVADVPDTELQAARATELVRQFNSPLFEFMALLTEADAARRGGDAAGAMQTLGRALPIGRAHGYINTWLWSPATMAELAALALDAEVEVDYVRRVVRERKLVPADASVETDAWPWPVKILTLGRFEVVTNERPVRFRGKAQRKPLALLQALVALGGHRVREDRLTEVLWPDADGDAARQALSTTLHRLRRLVGVEGAIVRADGGISLARDRCWVDVWAIERMIARAESAIARSPVRDHEWASSVRWTDRAVALYRGDFLGGDLASPAAAGVGERIRDRLLRQLRRLGHLWESIGDWEEAAECYERAVALNECAEEFYRRLMVAYQRLDRRGDAILTYERCRKNLSSAFGIAPSSATEAVRREVTPAPTA